VVAAATCPDKPGVLGLLIDERTSNSYLADSGSVYSLIPHQSSTPPTGPRLVTADKKPVACWGECVRTLHVAGRRFTWKFLLAAVAFPIVGADFLTAFKLMVDLDKMRLVHNTRGWHVPLAAPPSSSTFAAIGVQLAEASGSPGGQRGPPSSAPCSGAAGPRQGQPLHVTPFVVSPGGQRRSTSWDVTPHPSLAEPAPDCGPPGGQRRSTPLPVGGVLGLAAKVTANAGSVKAGS